MIGFGRLQKMSPADLVYPVSHKFAHPYYVAPGLVREPANRAFSGRRRKSLRGLRFAGAPGVRLGLWTARDVGRIWAFWDSLGGGCGRAGALGFAAGLAGELYIYI